VDLLPRVLDHYRAAGVPGLVDADEAPWPGAEAAGGVAELAADATAVSASGPPAGVTIRTIPLEAWVRIRDLVGRELAGWERILPFLLGTPGVTAFAAEEGGRPIAAAALVRHRKVGSLVMGVVHPDARGRGIQRALIAARAEAARADGCDLLVSEADADTVSERNLLAMGFERLRLRRVWRFDPANDPAPATTERDRVA
jgi:GNAT superfamily N-acetyltransferase